MSSEMSARRVIAIKTHSSRFARDGSDILVETDGCVREKKNLFALRAVVLGFLSTFGNWMLSSSYQWVQFLGFCDDSQRLPRKSDIRALKCDAEFIISRQLS
jgi:hypothetical protein